MHETGTGIVLIKLSTLLRWLALVVVIVNLAVAIVVTVAVSGTGGVFSTATFFYELFVFTTISAILYALSYIVSKDGDIKTVFGLSIVHLLRYMIVALLIVGLIMIVLWSIAIPGGGGGTVGSFLKSLLYTVVAIIILYTLSYILTRKQEQASQIEYKTLEIAEALLSDEETQRVD